MKKIGNYFMTSSVSCSTCTKSLTGTWSLNVIKGSEKTGRHLGIPDGYFVSQSNDPSRVFVYCQTCWNCRILGFPFVRELSDQMTRLTTETIQLNVEKKSLTSEVTALKSNNEDLRTKINSLISDKEDMESKIKQLNADLEAIRGGLPKDGNNLVLQYRDNRVAEGQFKDFYDCRIMTDSFFTLLENKSWPIEFKNYEEYLQLKNKPTSKVAVLGYENTGKSFILGKLTGSELPQGTLTKTTGICLKYPTDKTYPWTALDTPGTNISIKAQLLNNKMAKYFDKKGLSEEDKVRMMLGDNILMENLLQQFVVTRSQVLLVVIGKLHRDDQRLISRIKSLRGKRIIIVHNLLEVREKEDVEKIIQEDVLETFPVIEKVISLERNDANINEEINQIVYLETSKNGTEAVEHIIMAHEGSPAGAYYNRTALSYIKTIIMGSSIVEPFDLIEAFFTHLNQNLNKYLSSKINLNQKTTPFVQEINESQIPTALKLNESSQYELKLSSADEFGQIKTFARESLDNVPYTVKIITQGADDKIRKTLRVELEMVGNCADDQVKARIHKVGDERIRVEIKGKSEDNAKRKHQDDVQDDIQDNTRKFGEFTILTEPINLTTPKEAYVVHEGEPFARINNEVPGLKILAWNLHKKEDDWNNW